MKQISGINEKLALGVFSITLLLLMHISIPNMGGTVAHPREYLIWVGILTIMLLGVINSITGRTFILPSYLKYFTAYVALILSTSLFNTIYSTDLFLINFMRITAALIIWLSIHQLRFESKDRDSLLLIILTSSVIESILVILKAFAASYYVHMLGTDLALTLAKLLNYVPHVGGAFQQKNLFASWAATGIAISLYFITTERFINYKGIKKAFIFISLFLLSAALILASSRAGILGVLLSIAVLLGTCFRRYSTVKKQLAVWILVLAIGTGAGLYLASSKGGSPGLVKGAETEMKAKAKWLSDTKQRSFTERLIMYDTSFEMFRDSPLFGQGFSNFGSTFMHFKAKVSEDNPDYKGMVYKEFISHPHNELLYILAESGVTGVFSILIALSGIALLFYRMGLERAGIGAALFLPLLLHMMVEYPLKLSTAHYLLFIILLYLITITDTREIRFTMKRGLAAAVLILVSALYCFAYVYTLKTYVDYSKYGLFKIKYMNTGIISEKDILPAVNNLYLKHWAVPDLMYRKALHASYDPFGNLGLINEFLLWNAGEKTRRPAKPSYNLEAMIYLNLAKADENDPMTHLLKAKSAIEEGLRLYPNDKEMGRVKNEIYNYAIFLIPKKGGRRQ